MNFELPIFVQCSMFLALKWFPLMSSCDIKSLVSSLCSKKLYELQEAQTTYRTHRKNPRIYFKFISMDLA